jgi:hypothetical protein
MVVEVREWGGSADLALSRFAFLERALVGLSSADGGAAVELSPARRADAFEWESHEHLVEWPVVVADCGPGVRFRGPFLNWMKRAEHEGSGEPTTPARHSLKIDKGCTS